MKFSDARFVKVALICVLLSVQATLSTARTRYEEYDSHPKTGVKLCKRVNNQVDSTDCRKFCECETDLATGGCDCKTLNCVCANMQLNFCDFQKVRLYI